eukprot:219663_1
MSESVNIPMSNVKAKNYWGKMSDSVVSKPATTLVNGVDIKSIVQEWKKQTVFSKLRSSRELRFGQRGCCCIFDNISLEIPISNKSIFSSNKNIVYKKVLNNISGIARPGELYGIIGSSGSGKSSLLSILSGNSKSVFPNKTKK